MEALDAARNLLPSWVRWLPWVVAGLLSASAYATTRLAMRLTGSTHPPEPWTERARSAFAPRQVAQTSRVIHLTAALMAAVSWGNAWATPAPWAASLLMLALAWVGPIAASLHFEHRLRGVPLGTLWRSWLASMVALMAPATVMILGVPFAQLPGAAGLIAASVVQLLVVVLSLGFGLDLAVALGLARHGTERVRTAVERASQRTGVKVAAVYEVDWALANALAFPLLKRVAFTQGALAVLDDAQLEVVAAHELGHLSEPIATSLMRPLALNAVAAVLLWGPRTFTIDLPHVAAALVLVVALLLGLARLARGAEQHADATAKDSAGTYAAALETIYRQNLVPAVMRRPGAHGHLYDRLTAAGALPSWPRPQPPPLSKPHSRVVAIIVPVTLMVLGAMVRIAPPTSEVEAGLAIGFGDRRPWPPAWLGSVADRPDDAVIFEKAALALAPKNVWVMSELATAQAHARQCPDAQQTLSQAYLEAMKKKLSRKTQAELDQASVIVGKECP